MGILEESEVKTERVEKEFERYVPVVVLEGMTSKLDRQRLDSH